MVLNYRDSVDLYKTVFIQKKYFGAKYSISDILLTTLGGVVAIVLVHFFT